MVRLGHMFITIALLLSIVLPGCTREEGPRIEEGPKIIVSDPFNEMVDKSQLTDEQVEILKAGTGTLRLTEQQVDLLRDTIEQVLEEPINEEWLGETRWQELCDIYNTLLADHEVDLQRVADLARDIYENLQEQEAVEVVTTLEKLSEEEAYVAQEQDTWASTLGTSTLVYTPGGADEGDMDFHYQPAQWGWARAWANYDTGANAESGGVAVYSESLLGLGSAEARARQRILIYVPYDDTDVTIEATVLYQTATSEYLMDAAGTYTTYRDLNDDSWVHESIDPLFGWLDAGKKVLGTIERIAAVLFLIVDAATLAEVVPIMDDIHDYEVLGEALQKDPSTGGERVVTHSANSLDAGYYYFEVGLRARTGSVLFGTAAALAIGQVTQIKVTQSYGEPITEFNLSISSTSGGTVTIPREGTLTYVEGTVVDLVATPDTGYRFVNWTGDVDTIADPNAASTTVTMNGDYSITANFEELLEYDLIISSSAGGSVNTPGEGAFTYYDGTAVILIAGAEEGYHFVSWSGDVDTIANVNAATTTITINGDYSITANFEEGEAVTFPDPNLEAVVRDGIGIPEGPIYPSDLEGFTVLYGTVDAISDLTGIEQCIDLVEVYLGSNQISDISPLASLANMTVLFLQNNQISDISALANLTNLTRLLLRDNEISDISALSNLTNLNYLNVGWNQINDISPLANLTTLTELYSRGNQISDISPLANLTNLTLLWHDGSHLSDISPLANLTNLTNLNIGYNDISDVSPLANLTNLTWLLIRYNDISDASPFTNLTNLGYLDIGFNLISDISPLANLTNLTELHLACNNYISDISPLANLSNLTELWLMDNQISDISPLANLTNLTWLHLGSNQISDISPLANLTNLTYLSVLDNHISDIWPLVQNEGLGTGDTVNLQMNPLSDDSINIYIPQLEARDVTVYFSVPSEFDLHIASTEGGEVTTPGEGAFTRKQWMMVDLVAEAEEGYRFVDWTGDVETIGDVNAASTTITMNGNYFITANFEEFITVECTPMIAAGCLHTVGLRADGTVVAVGENYNGQCEVGDWNGIIQVAAGGYHTVGLKVDGTVVTVGLNSLGQCDVGDWTAIIQVAAGYLYTVGLKVDGTVVAVGDNDEGQCNIGGWNSIVQVDAGGDHTVGLKSNGTVAAVGYNYYGQCMVGGWTGITQPAAGYLHTVGLKSNGTVVAVGNNDEGQCNIGGWNSIVQIAAGLRHTVGLKADSSVVAVGWNGWGQCDVGDWTNITQIAAGADHTVGLKTDGAVVAVGYNNYGQCNVGGWTLN